MSAARNCPLTLPFEHGLQLRDRIGISRRAQGDDVTRENAPTQAHGMTTLRIPGDDPETSERADPRRRALPVATARAPDQPDQRAGSRQASE
jgi:hypothetical protein